MGSFASFKEKGRSDHVKMDSLPIQYSRQKKEKNKGKKNLSARPEILIKLHNEPSRRKNWGL